ncbi:hypothetical protein, partial [Couchioplanes azureus]
RSDVQRPDEVVDKRHLIDDQVQDHDLTLDHDLTEVLPQEAVHDERANVTLGYDPETRRVLFSTTGREPVVVFVTGLVMGGGVTAASVMADDTPALDAGEAGVGVGVLIIVVAAIRSVQLSRRRKKERRQKEDRP